MLYDLSYRIENGIKEYPNDSKTIIITDKEYIKDGYKLSTYSTSLHTGTHIDFPSHLTDSDKTAHDYPVSRFTGRGRIICVEGVNEIGLKKEFDDIKKDDIVILYTGFETYYKREKYFDEHPVISEELALYLVNRGISMIGFDMPSCDRYPFLIHKIFLRNDILILENLRNLEALYEKMKSSEKLIIYAFPLDIYAEASQVRVIANVT
ncbi:MAG: cyclase family protein [Clostridia bacterium]